ncbi:MULTISPECIES: phage holin family protein [unclassified Leifsonia]|uniref:phage holin family protein n=1 Tax=unclassified Leifsonia TaxID=2663824 RepID=UPI0008A78E16|nr:MULTISPECIES: phage holin family protein [unclassified Leifsonia]SEH61448.1 Putative Holin-X, holin superfamily III [Leifsonia sp. CL154]SFL17938.1 Putative Holin-X, holin superfamily III [Leifsonia sp. CL147]
MADQPPLPRERRRTTRGLRPLPQLAKDLVAQLRRLIASELALFKAEMAAKAKAAGMGAGLLAGALLFLFFAFGVLVTAAVLGFALILPAWLAALIVAAILIVIAVVIGLIGWRSLKRGMPPVPDDLGSELGADYQALKGKRP